MKMHEVVSEVALAATEAGDAAVNLRLEGKNDAAEKLERRAEALATASKILYEVTTTIAREKANESEE